MSKGTILVMDDTRASLKLLFDLLSEEGYHVRPTDCGPLALTSAVANPPDLMLLDIRMPGMNGFEVCRRLKDDVDTRDIPIIFISAATETADRVEGLKLGAVDFITKPFEREELLARVRIHLELARLRSGLGRLVMEQTSELDEANAQLRKANEELEHALNSRRGFLHDVLFSVTEGRLHLCYNADELPEPLTPFGPQVRIADESGLHQLRTITYLAAHQAGLPAECADDLVTATHEAAMNSLVHCGDGVAKTYIDNTGNVEVRIDDEGPGIALIELPRATLSKGYSTAGTFGHGMKIMLACVDCVYLLTGPTGTTIVLRQGREKPIDYRLS